MTFENYRNYLEDEFTKRKNRNPSYSLRSFARDLEMSPSRLSEAMNERRGISLKSANALIKNLRLDKWDADIFRLSVEAEHSRSKSTRLKAQEKLAKLLAEPKEHPKTSTIVNWVAEALLKMSERQSVTEESNDIAKKLEIPHFMVVSSLRFLTRLGFIAGTKKYKSSLKSRSQGLKLNVDYLQILEQAQKAYRGMKSAQDLFCHRAFLLERKDVLKANKILLNALSDIEKLEKRSQSAKVIFVANQIFSIENGEN